MIAKNGVKAISYDWYGKGVDCFHSVEPVDFRFCYYSYSSVVLFSDLFCHFGMLDPMSCVCSKVFVCAFLFYILDSGVLVNLDVFSGEKFSFFECGFGTLIKFLSSPKTILMSSLKPFSIVRRPESVLGHSSHRFSSHPYGIQKMVNS